MTTLSGIHTDEKLKGKQSIYFFFPLKTRRTMVYCGRTKKRTHCAMTRSRLTITGEEAYTYTERWWLHKYIAQTDWKKKKLLFHFTENSSSYYEVRGAEVSYSYNPLSPPEFYQNPSTTTTAISYKREKFLLVKKPWLLKPARAGQVNRLKF